MYEPEAEEEPDYDEIISHDGPRKFISEEEINKQNLRKKELGIEVFFFLTFFNIIFF